MSEQQSSSSPILDKKIFWNRLRSLYNDWRKGGKNWGNQSNNNTDNIDTLILSYGKINDDVEYSKYKTLQLFLLGVEADDTHFIFVGNDVNTLYILTGPKKVKLLQQYGDIEPTTQKFKLEILQSDKTDNNAANIKKILSVIKASNKRIGVIGQTIYEDDNYASKTSKALNSALKDQGYEYTDITNGITSVLSVKDKYAVDNITTAASITSNILRKYLLPTIENCLDEGTEVTHLKLADDTDDVIRDPSKHNIKLDNGIEYDDIESCYTPIIQSGFRSDFDLKPSATSNDEKLTLNDGVIIVQLGTKYKSYCSNIGRTYFINPTDEQRLVYSILTDVFINCKKALKVGNKINDVYNAAINTIKQSKRSDLVNNFTKNCGFGIGIDFREANLIINEKNNRVINKNMTFNLNLGFSDLTTKVKHADKNDLIDRHYSVLLSDTVVINDSNNDDQCETLTHAARDWKEIAYYLGDEDEVESEHKEEEQYTSGVSTRHNRTAAQMDVDESAEEQRRIQQAELARKQREQALKEFAKQEFSKGFDNSSSSDKMTKTVAYKSINDYPNIKHHSIHVDIDAESILFPIGDYMVPFHISTVKNVYKAENAGFTYLSIQFNVPDNISQTNAKVIRELTFRGRMNGKLDESFFKIKELRKRVQDRIKEYDAMKDIVKQEELQITKVGLIPQLKDIFVRPQISKRKNVMGNLQAHTNGFRYVTTDKIKIDIIYNNIKHCYYAPADNTASVIIHFELKKSILLDPNSKIKKTNYVQFYVDVVEASEDLSNMAALRRENIDEDELERRNRKKHNERFLNFVKQTEDLINKLYNEKQITSKLEFDIPYNELAFSGVPNKQQVTLYPTVHSLVALDDIPPVVIPLNEICVVSFERVVFGLRDFDMVIVWKDFNKPVQRIDSVPIKHLKDIKDWLNSCEIVFYERDSLIVWKQAMTQITADLETFWKVGGFEYMLTNKSVKDITGQTAVELLGDTEDARAFDETRDGGDEEEGQESEPEPEESEFEYESDSSGDEDEYDSSSDDSDVSSDDYDESDDEDADDWDELDRKAKQEDEHKAMNRKLKGAQYDSDDDDRPRKPVQQSTQNKKLMQQSNRPIQQQSRPQQNKQPAKPTRR